jgi:hypothetical protein
VIDRVAWGCTPITSGWYQLRICHRAGIGYVVVRASGTP